MQAQYNIIRNTGEIYAILILGVSGYTGAGIFGLIRQSFNYGRGKPCPCV
jgi:hypothetical protein